MHPSDMPDPDAQGLPPHVLLPPAAAYRRDQLRARLVVCLIATVALVLLTFVSQQYRTLAIICTALAAVATLVMAVRFALAWRKAARAAHAS